MSGCYHYVSDTILTCLASSLAALPLSSRRLESATQNSKMDAPGVLQEIRDFQAEAL